MHVHSLFTCLPKEEAAPLCRERLEGAKQKMGLSQEALLQEQHDAHQMQLQAREETEAAEQALQAVAVLLHQLAPQGDLATAALALRQVNPVNHHT